MKSQDIREKFLAFFESKGHLRHASSSLVPDDPTLLTTSAGMVQFKPYFLALKKPPRTRLTTSQKCLRAKDIEEVGRTPRHHTFFEMLGNFSFGDYFKEDAIAWAWEFLTGKDHLNIDPARLRISVYLEDDEAYNIWKDKIGIPEDRIFRFGENENFWPAGAPSQGPNGPCGPCSEIFYDFGSDRGCGRPDCDPSCDCNRHIEIWNLVFMQFERHDGGKLTPLPNKNIDTGSGLERVASVLQGAPTNFETDLFMPIINRLEQITGKNYQDSPVPFRVIADHLRGASFLICDGVFPSNEGRGYLLRKILRRAALNARTLGVEQAFVYQAVDAVAESLGKHYPEIVEKLKFVMLTIKTEEELFEYAINHGTEFLTKIIANNLLNDIHREYGFQEEFGRKYGLEFSNVNPNVDLSKILSNEILNDLSDKIGNTLFKAYDTFGLPHEQGIDIVQSILCDSGIIIAEEQIYTSFEKSMSEQRDRSRKGSKMDGDVFVEDAGAVFRDAAEARGAGAFHGYDRLSEDTKIVSLVVNGAAVDAASRGDAVDIVTETTPFYGEMGGQIGDTGEVTSPNGKAAVRDTFVVDGKIMVHRCEVTQGMFKTGDAVTLCVDISRRNDIMRHHTATHLLHAALRAVLGEHVAQAGSYVGPDKLRFDFTHNEQVTKEQLRQIEDIVNSRVLACEPVLSEVKDIASAKSEGAMALFGEKYGDEVRVVSISSFSKELCGGTHVHNTGFIGPVKIVDERTIGSNMRRIEALAGPRAIEYVYARLDILAEAAAVLRVPEGQLPQAVQSVAADRDALNKELRKLKEAKAKEEAAGLMDDAGEVNGTVVLVKQLHDADRNAMLSVYDDIKVKAKSYAVALGAECQGKVMFLTAFSDDLVERGFDAGKLIKDVAQVAGGGGGGKKHMAQAGAKDASKIPDALEKGRGLILEQLKG